MIEDELSLYLRWGTYSCIDITPINKRLLLKVSMIIIICSGMLARVELYIYIW